MRAKMRAKMGGCGGRWVNKLLFFGPGRCLFVVEELKNVLKFSP
jgi:hypothetical protein